MSTPKSPEQLASQIDALVAAYIAQAQQIAQDALAQAFTRRTPRVRSTQRATTSSKAKPSRSPVQRRTPAQVAELGEKLYAVVRAHPGKSMTAFAAELGVSVRALERPMARLRQGGRVRRIGERNLTRYFPVLGTRASA